MLYVWKRDYDLGITYKGSENRNRKFKPFLHKKSTYTQFCLNFQGIIRLLVKNPHSKRGHRNRKTWGKKGLCQ